MIIELRATDRLRGPKAVDVAPVLTAILQTVRDGAVDPARLRVVCDWVQYRQSFRPPVDLRTITASAFETARAGRNGLVGRGEAYELAIDLRRSGAVDLAVELADMLADRTSSGCGSARPCRRVYLEPPGPGTASCIWAFNALFWKELALWEQATGRGYEQALPSGESDARNAEATHELILRLFALWDDLAARRALPEELHVLELGVGNGNQARVWLDEFRRLDQELGKDYYRRLHYLMGDYSPRVLELARANLGDHAERLSCLILDATRPTETLGFLRYKAFLVYISNVYDNLPTDEIVHLGGQLFRVEVRAYLPGAAAEQIGAELGMTPDELPAMVARLLRLGPELLSEALPERFPTPVGAAEFWRAVWEALRLEECYAPFEELDAYEVAPGVSGEILRPILEAAGDTRAHVSNGAVASFADTLPLLHPMGMLLCHDLFVTDLHQYRTGFRGPGKYDGSVVNWVSGPLLAAVASRRGYDVGFAPFAHRPGSNVTTMTTSVRE
jgi:SAM-dependent methyltransferase